MPPLRLPVRSRLTLSRCTLRPSSVRSSVSRLSVRIVQPPPLLAAASVTFFRTVVGMPPSPPSVAVAVPSALVPDDVHGSAGRRPKLSACPAASLRLRRAAFATASRPMRWQGRRQESTWRRGRAAERALEGHPHLLGKSSTGVMPRAEHAPGACALHLRVSIRSDRHPALTAVPSPCLVQSDFQPTSACHATLAESDSEGNQRARPSTERPLPAKAA
jgi:hypothetical protein